MLTALKGAILSRTWKH